MCIIKNDVLLRTKGCSMPQKKTLDLIELLICKMTN